MRSESRPRSPLWMVVLSLVCEEPMHPYRMQQLIKARGKDEVANVVQRNSVYQTIGALLRAELISIRETSRHERRPERTVYEVTSLGRATLDQWLKTVLSTPAKEYGDFPAALSLASILGPDELRTQLVIRIENLGRRLHEVARPIADLPRLFSLETEYEAAVIRAEIAWLTELVTDLSSGSLTWSDEWIRQIAAALEPATSTDPEH